MLAKDRNKKLGMQAFRIGEYFLASLIDDLCH